MFRRVFVGRLLEQLNRSDDVMRWFALAAWWHFAYLMICFIFMFAFLLCISFDVGILTDTHFAYVYVISLASILVFGFIFCKIRIVHNTNLRPIKVVIWVFILLIQEPSWKSERLFCENLPCQKAYFSRVSYLCTFSEFVSRGFFHFDTIRSRIFGSMETVQKNSLMEWKWGHRILPGFFIISFNLPRLLAIDNPLLRFTPWSLIIALLNVRVADNRIHDRCTHTADSITFTGCRD